jgi:hypothetical protein
MTVLTMPSRGTGAEPGPVPWRGMLWVTWRQHRGLLVTVLTASAVAVGGMVFAGLQIHHDYAALMSCRPAGSATCQDLSDRFFGTDWHLAQGIHAAVFVAPVLLAMFAGPPVLARELENATFRYAWTQGMGRMRWTVGKLVSLSWVLTIAALVISQLFSWLFAPFLKPENITVVSLGVFDAEGIALAGWTLAGFCLGAFVGMFVRRVLPAMVITLGAYAALVGATVFYLRDHYPVGTFWPMQVFETGWLLLLSALLVASTVCLVRRHAS